MITIGRLAPKDQWDQNILDLLFANHLYPTGLNFKRVEGFPTGVSGAIIIIPGRYWVGKANEISEAISRYDWVLAIRAGDEENLFDPDRVYHRNLKWWIQTPHVGVDYDNARLFGVGFPPHFNHLRENVRDIDVFLSAQNTHSRRQECFAKLGGLTVTKLVQANQGFTQGMVGYEYADCMGSTKIAPAPSGAVSPDSFRLYEALEAHAIPIADDISPTHDSAGYWRMIFPDAPFPILETYEQLPGYIEDQLKGWPANANKIAAWWINQKREMGRWLFEDLSMLGGI